VADVLVNHYLI